MSGDHSQARADGELPWRRLILVAGLARGGTTWLGELLSAHPKLEYIFEPFSYRYHPPSENGLRVRQVLSPHLPPPSSPCRFWSFQGPALEQARQHSEMVRDLLIERVRQLHGETRIDCLVIKQPAAEKLGYLAEVLDPSLVVFLDRSPMGIVSSYLERGYMETWHEPEWRLASETLQLTNPELAPLLDLASDPIEQLTLLLRLKRRIAEQQLAGRSTLFLDYDALASDTPGALSRVFQAIGVDHDPAVIQLCIAETQARRPIKGKAHLDVRGRAIERSMAWARKLSPSSLARIRSVTDRLGEPQALPGSGLPPQSMLIRVGTTFRDLERRARKSMLTVIRMLSRLRNHLRSVSGSSGKLGA